MILRSWPLGWPVLSISNIARDLLFNFLLQKKNHELLSKLTLLSWRITIIWGTLKCFQMCTLNCKGEKLTHSAWYNKYCTMYEDEYKIIRRFHVKKTSQPLVDFLPYSRTKVLYEAHLLYQPLISYFYVRQPVMQIFLFLVSLWSLTDEWSKSKILVFLFSCAKMHFS